MTQRARVGVERLDWLKQKRDEARKRRPHKWLEASRPFEQEPLRTATPTRQTSAFYEPKGIPTDYRRTGNELSWGVTHSVPDYRQKQIDGPMTTTKIEEVPTTNFALPYQSHDQF